MFLLLLESCVVVDIVTGVEVERVLWKNGDRETTFCVGFVLDNVVVYEEGGLQVENA